MATGEKTELDYPAEIARWTREAAIPSVRGRVERLLTPTRRSASTPRWRLEPPG